MDDIRFDALARCLGSRRSLLAGVAVALSAAPVSVAARKGRKKKDKKPKPDTIHRTCGGEPCGSTTSKQILSDKDNRASFFDRIAPDRLPRFGTGSGSERGVRH